MKKEEAIAMRISRNSILVNILLSISRLVAGLAGRSSAMISDSIHSASDVFSTIVVIAGVKISNRESDKNHPYGHERLESVASIILATILAITGIGIGYGGIQTIMAGSKGGDIPIPSMLPLVAAIVSVVVKEGMYWYTMHGAKQINSGALKADAWHHRSDALSSVGSFVGILGAKMGYPLFDPIASVIICIFILKAAVEIFMDAVGKMTDEACDDATEEKIRETVQAQQGVMEIDDLKTRLFGNKIYVDIEISVDGNVSLYEAHGIAEKVHDEVEASSPLVKHCMVHVNPYEKNTSNT